MILFQLHLKKLQFLLINEKKIEIKKNIQLMGSADAKKNVPR